MLGHYLSAVAVLGLLALVPGPDVAVVTRCAVQGGRRAGFEAAAGMVTGLAVWAVLAVVGLPAILAASATAYAVVRLVGAAYLILLGVTALWRTRRGVPVAEVHARDARSAWSSGVLTNLLNPKVAVIYTSLLPSLVPRASGIASWLALLAATHIALSLAILVIYATTAGAFRQVLSGSRGQVVLQRLTGVTLVALGIRVAAER